MSPVGSSFIPWNFFSCAFFVCFFLVSWFLGAFFLLDNCLDDPLVFQICKCFGKDDTWFIFCFLFDNVWGIFVTLYTSANVILCFVAIKI